MDTLVKTPKDVVLSIPPRLDNVPRPSRRRGPCVIEETWRLLSQRLEREGAPTRDIINMRQAFVAAAYACSQAIVLESAGSAEMSEAAQRVEAAC